MVNTLKRETSVEELAGILSSGQGESDLQKAEKKRQKVVDDFVWRALMETSWHPKLVDMSGHRSRAKAITVATALAVGSLTAGKPGAALGLGVVLTGSKQLDLVVESRWYARLQVEATKRFSRERIWTRVDGSAIEPTINEFLQKYRT